MDRSAARGAALGATAAVAIGVLTSRGKLRELDDRLFKRINRDRGPLADRVLDRITDLGSFWAALGASAAIAATGRRRAAADALAAATAAWLLGQGAKKVFGRARPYDAMTEMRLLISKQMGTSWPSSHPLVFTAFATVAARDLGVGAGGRAVLDGLAGLVAYSRVHVGVHYPSDVAGGLLIGRAFGRLWTAAVSPAVLRDGR